MACGVNILVNSARAIQLAPNQPPSTIEVSGTAQECDVVEVQLIGAGSSAVVAVAVIDGAWTAVFNAPSDFHPADFPCGVQDVKVNAACKGDPNCQDSDAIPVINCQPRDCPNQAVVVVHPLGDPGSPVNPNNCLAPGTYVVRIADPLLPAAVYQWSLNGATQPAASGAGQNEYTITLNPGDAPQALSVVIFISPQCFLSSGATLSLCGPPAADPNCPNQVSLQVEQGGGAFTPTDGCYPAGSYVVRVTDPTGPDVSYIWSIDNVLQVGQGGSTLPITLAAGQTRSVQVSAQRGECTAVPGSITLNACPDANCLEDIVYRVIGEGRQPVNTANCLPAGRYTVVIEEPAGPGVVYEWRIDGIVQAGQTGRTLPVTVVAGAQMRVTVRVTAPGCPELRERIDLSGCRPTRDCETQVTMVVLNANGTRVPTGGCLQPGRYTVRVESPVGPDVTYIWTVNGDVQAGQTGRELSVTVGQGGAVNVAVVANRAGCEGVPDGLTLRGCGDDDNRPPDVVVPEPPDWCFWLRLAGLAALIVGLALIFAGFCSGNIPLAIVGGVLAALGFGLLVAWALLCGIRGRGCDALRALILFLSWLAIVLGVIAAVFGVIALICAQIASPTGWLALLCSLPGACGIGAVIDFGIVGVLLAVLTVIYFAICGD